MEEDIKLLIEKYQQTIGDLKSSKKTSTFSFGCYCEGGIEMLNLVVSNLEDLLQHK